MIPRPARFIGRPVGLLTRHFFHALFDFGVLTREGADAFVRVIIGLIALLISLGLLLARMYALKYAALSAAATAEPYALALAADTTFAIALAMWIIALVTVLVSGSLFPDETDFRVLTPLPIGRNAVFGAKLLALTLFTGLFMLASHLAVTPLVLLISLGRWSSVWPPLSVLAFWTAGIPASMFAVLAVTAMNGLLMTCTPRSLVRLTSAAMRSATLAALVLALPFIIALPAQGLPLARHSPLFLLAPPAWFMGLERVLLGSRDEYFLRLALLAAGASGLAAAVTISSYIILYRRFDRIMLRSLAVSKRGARWRRTANPVRAAIREFTAATLGRSPLHQGALVGLSACGVALAMDGLVRAGALTRLHDAGSAARNIGALASAPFPLVIVMGLAARISLSLPIESEANWIFRITECASIRVDQLREAERVMTRFGAVLPVALTLPLQYMAAGSHAFVASALTAVAGRIWVEMLLRDWRRLPFTCSYTPGKRPVAQVFLAGLTLYVVVGSAGSALERAALTGSSATPAMIVAGLAVVALALRWRRWRKWRETPLAFDDEPPSNVLCLGLSAEAQVARL